jgi:hypothetical protein
MNTLNPIDQSFFWLGNQRLRLRQTNVPLPSSPSISPAIAHEIIEMLEIEDDVTVLQSYIELSTYLPTLLL